MMRAFCLLAVAMLLQSPLRAQAQKRNLTQFLEETVSAERCAPADKRAGMIKAVQSRFADRALAVVDGPALPAAQAVGEVVTAGCMRSLAPARTAGLALAAYGAVMRGAHPGVVRAIASYGLDKDVSEERIRAWADGYAQMTAGRVPAETASEAVRNALDNGWSDKTFNEVKWGLVHAAKSGFDLKDFSSFVFARMLKDKTRPGAAVAEAQSTFAKAKAEGKAPAVPAYQGLFIPFVQEPPQAEVTDEAVKAGRPKGPVKPAFIRKPNEYYSTLQEGEKVNMEGQQGPGNVSPSEIQTVARDRAPHDTVRDEAVEAGRPKEPIKPAFIRRPGKKDFSTLQEGEKVVFDSQQGPAGPSAVPTAER